MAFRRAAVAALASLGILAAATVAYASEVGVAVVDVTTPINAVTLAPGGSGPITINMTVTGNQEGTATFDVYRDWTLSGGTFTGSNPKEFTVAPRRAQDAPTTFSTTGTVTIATGQSDGTFTLAASAFDITNSNQQGAKLGIGTASSYAVTVLAPTPSNAAPVVAADSASVAVDEGSPATMTGTWSDADEDTVELTASYGTVAANSDGTWSWSATPSDGPIDTQTVTITANDGTTTSSTTFGLVVNNVAPSIASSLNSSIDCRTNAVLNLSFADQGVNDGPWAVGIDWGDGGGDTTFTAAAQGTQSVDGHLYTSPGDYTVTVTVTDKDGGSKSVTHNVQVQQTYATTFLAPFDGASPSNLVTNTMKNGRVVPVKIKIFDECSLGYVTDPTTAVTIKISSTGAAGTTADPVEVYADAGASSAGTDRFRWSTDGFWIYNLDSKSLGLQTNNVYRVDAYVAGSKATSDNWALLKPVK